jgi:hypothetical protein
MPMMFGFSTHRQRLLEAELERIAAEVPPFGARRMILVGELARGQVGPETELVLVLVQETEEPFHRRPDFWVTHLRPRVGTRFLVYTPQEFDSLQEIDPLLIAAGREGRRIVD